MAGKPFQQSHLQFLPIRFLPSLLISSRVVSSAVPSELDSKSVRQLQLIAKVKGGAPLSAPTAGTAASAHPGLPFNARCPEERVDMLDHLQEGESPPIFNPALRPTAA